MKPAALATAVFVMLTLLTVFLTTMNDTESTDCTPRQGGSVVVEGVPAGQLAKPMKTGDGQLTSSWRTSNRSDHEGMDLAGPPGTPIYALADGVVVAAGPATGFGQWIVIDHQLSGQLYSTVYGHMNDDGLLVSAGDQVKAGQHIANQGFNGVVSPPGPAGTHLHFEVWEGGRLSGGNDVDPMPWYERAVEPGTAGSAPTPPAPAAPPSAGAELAALPASVGSEAHFQIDTVRVARAVHAKFPQVETIGGWRAQDPYPDHPSGRAADIMIPNYTTSEGKELGNAIRDYLWTNRAYFNIEYMIWRQEYIPSQGTPSIMEDRGSATQNHFDHVHVTTVGGGMPKLGQLYGGLPNGETASPPDASDDCTLSGPVGDSGGDLAEGAVPPEFEKWLKISATQCAEISPGLLAAQIQQESGFQPNRVSSAGANGYTQFMPDTWAAFGHPVDENGEIAGPAGAGDPNDIADAVMAQGRYDCYVADYLRPKLASGQVTGDPIDLMLAGYNAGPAAVEQFGGIPPYPETQAYVPSIRSSARLYEAT